MASAFTHFEWADRGRVSVYKFRLGVDPTVHVWFEYGDGTGALFSTPQRGPFRADEPLLPTPFPGLEPLLGARGATKAGWIEDLMAQYGERIGWKYP